MGENTRLRIGTTQGLYEIGAHKNSWFDGETVHDLALENGRWWALVGQGQVWRQGAGDKWSQKSDPPPDRARCLYPTPNGLFIGTDSAHLYRLKDSSLQLVEPFEAAPSREQWFTPWGGPPAIRSLAAADGTLFVNVHVGGILRSADDGASWEPSIDLNADVHEVLYDNGSGLLLAASARGLAVSQNRGDSWTYHTKGLHGSYLRAVAVVNGILIVSASTGAHSSRAAVYRKSLEGEDPFDRCSEGLPAWFSNNIDTGCVAASGDSAAFGTESGDIFVSHDRGGSWQPLAEGLPPVRCLSLS